MSVVIDGLGGDNAPLCVVEGLALAQSKNKNFFCKVTGKKEELENLFDKYKIDRTRAEIVECNDVISNCDSPTMAIKRKTDSSLVKAFDVLKSDDNCTALISAGPTGAVLTGSILKIGRIAGVSRPALAPFLPTQKGGKVLLCDCGANVDCKPIHLCHFALLASQYVKSALNIENPRIALLSNGAEAGKGNDLVKTVYPMLEEMNINFVGNVEARYVMSGDYDAVICDGFDGNVFLKSVEGTFAFAMSDLKTALYKNFRTKIGALLCKKGLKAMKEKLDYNKYGGSVFVGCKKNIIKSHGSSKGETMMYAIMQALNLETSGLIANIESAFENLKEGQENKND